MPLSKQRNRDRMRVKRGCGGSMGVCASCGEGRVTDNHHKDSNRENNQLNNIITLCPTCHALITRKVLKLEELMQQPKPVQPVQPIVRPFRPAPKPTQGR